MAERYTRLFSLPERLYCEGSPVIIEAGALLEDKVESRVVARLKLRSVSDRRIKAAEVRIDGFDAAGDYLGETTFRFLGLSVEANAEFGMKEAIVLPNAAIRSFSCTCTAVVFEDGEEHAIDPSSIWDSIPRQEPLADRLGEFDGLVGQYRRDTSVRSGYCPMDYEDLWLCACGAANRASSTACCACQVDKRSVFDSLELRGLVDRRNAWEQSEIGRKTLRSASRQEDGDALAEKTSPLRGGAVLVGVAAVVLLLMAVLAGSMYGSASDTKEIGVGQVEAARCSELALVQIEGILSAETVGDALKPYSDWYFVEGEESPRLPARFAGLDGYFQVVPATAGESHYQAEALAARVDRVIFRWNADGAEASDQDVMDAIVDCLGAEGEKNPDYDQYDWRIADLGLKVSFYPGKGIWFELER